VRAKIRERTKQAMSNPEVRERLRDHGHTQSAETRSLIRERMRAAWQRKKQERLAALALLAEWQGELAAAARVGLAGDRELVRCGNGRVVYADEAYRSNVARGMKSVQRAQPSAHPTSPAPAPAAAPRPARARRAVREGERERRETTKDTVAGAAAAGVQEAEGGGEGGEGAAARGAEEAVVVQQADEAFVQAVMAAESAQAEGAQGAQGAVQQGAELAQGNGGGMRFKRVLIVRQAGGSAGQEEVLGVGGEERVEESTGLAVRVGLLGEGGLQGGEEAMGVEERDEEDEGKGEREGGWEEEEVESDVEDMKTLVEARGNRTQAKEGSEGDGGAGQGSVSGGMHGGDEAGNGAVVRHPHAPPSAAPVPALLPLSPTTHQRRLARQLIARRRRQLAERARVLMQEAASAAQSLEALAARDATAMASLLETRRLLEQAGRTVARAERTPALPLAPKAAQGGGPAQRVPGGDWRSGLSGSGGGSAAWTHAGATPECGGVGGQARGQVRGVESGAGRAGPENGAVSSADGVRASERVVGSMGGVPGSEWQGGRSGGSSAAQGKWVEGGGEGEGRGASGSVEWVVVNGARISVGAAQGREAEGRQDLQGVESGGGEGKAVDETLPGGAGQMNGRAGHGGSEGDQEGGAGKR
ncbi:unnamed protein product, partial [Closterium sp. NIES-65]